MDEEKPYYSLKYKLNGYKFEAAILPDGIAVHVSSHCSGAKSGLEIFRPHIDKHGDLLRKWGVDLETEETKTLRKAHPSLWALLFGEGYYEAEQIIRAIHAANKSPNRMLSPNALIAENSEISSDWIIVDNVFGHTCSLWSILSSKYI